MRRTFVLLWGMSISGSWAVAVPTIDWCSRNILGALLGRLCSLPSPLNNAIIIPVTGRHDCFSQCDCSHQFVSLTRLIRGSGTSAIINEAIYALNYILRCPMLYLAQLTSVANICFPAFWVIVQRTPLRSGRSQHNIYNTSATYVQEWYVTKLHIQIGAPRRLRRVIFEDNVVCT